MLEHFVVAAVVAATVVGPGKIKIILSGKIDSL
jgi:hypothetical protein